MPEKGRSLGTKIIGMLLIFLLAALVAIGVTLFMSWKLMGSSAAINDAGSLRMQIYRMGYLNARQNAPAADPVSAAELSDLAERFDRTLENLRAGDPARPLFIPRSDGIPQAVDRLLNDWRSGIRPLLQRVSGSPATTAENPLDVTLRAYVSDIDAVVFKMERSYARSTYVLQISQLALLVLAALTTMALVRFFFVQVVRPAKALAAGVAHWREGDFTYRLALASDDELGRLGEGFNLAAGHLQNMYATLEEKVAEKTRSLREKNHELEILYSVSDFLREPADTENLCQGFASRVARTMQADAAAVRLFDRDGGQLCLAASEGLDGQFIEREALISCSACQCGAASGKPGVLVADTDDAIPPLARTTCRQAGYRIVVSAGIPVGERIIGVFNLFFKARRFLDTSDRQLIESLCKQLGTAIDNRRLQSRERELAVAEERNLLARELHDSIAQALAFMNLQVQMLDDALDREAIGELKPGIALLRQGLQESYDDVRELMTHFRARLDARDLDAAIGAALERLSEQAGVETRLDIRGESAPLDAEVETQVLYIIQEALSNIRKHARARSAAVDIERTTTGLRIVIRDDGIGFETARDASEAALPSHIGLLIMRERALRIGARLHIHSGTDSGTKVTIVLERHTEANPGG